jgi:hypothetical protein
MGWAVTPPSRRNACRAWWRFSPWTPTLWGLMRTLMITRRTMAGTRTAAAARPPRRWGTRSRGAVLAVWRGCGGSRLGVLHGERWATAAAAMTLVGALCKSPSCS